MITAAAMRNGFTGGLIVDFPNSKKAKKYFLFLMAGYSEEIIKEAQEAVFLPKAKTQGNDYDFAESDSDEEEGDSEMDAEDDDEEEKNESDAEEEDEEESDDGYKREDK